MTPPKIQAGQVFSVAEITGLLKEIIETSFRTITVEGEISNFKPSTSGHIYFTLKDSSAQMSAVMFRSSAFRLSFRPRDGDKVRCTGSLTVYPPRGNYQLVVTGMEKAGTGDILMMLEQRKRRLAEEGIFSQERKRKLPEFPRTIGVVTSPSGAAVRDILQIARRRNRSVSVIVFPALVQGEGAAETIVKMIEIANFYRMCDVLIIGRGGGSLEDLLPFSDESVVRAVASSGIPTVSAVGHEIDWALCDYAADRRAPTPSAAAEMTVPLEDDIRARISSMKEMLRTSIRNRIDNTRLMIKTFDPEFLMMRFRAIQQPLLLRLDSAKEEMAAGIRSKTDGLRRRTERCVTVLEEANPKRILGRGYSMVRVKETGEILRNSAQAHKGTEIEIFPAEGTLTAAVTETANKISG